MNINILSIFLYFIFVKSTKAHLHLSHLQLPVSQYGSYSPRIVSFPLAKWLEHGASNTEAMGSIPGIVQIQIQMYSRI